MGWLAASIALLGVIYFSIHHSGFRKGVLVVVGVLALIALGWAVYLRNENERLYHKQALAKSVIGKNQIVISEATLSLGPASEVSGVVTNLSSYALHGFILKVTVIDCKGLFDDLLPKADTQNRCGIIGDERVNVYVKVPPGQKRAFSYYVSLSNLPKVDQWKWFYAVEETTADMD